MQKVISVDRLKFSYGKKVVLDDVSFDVNVGQVIGLIGENGAGKTTLLKILLGLLPSNETVRILNQPAGKSQGIGLMSQENLKLTGVTVKDILQEAAIQTNSNIGWKSMASELGLLSIANSKLDSLSGGQLRQVNFGVALIGNPQIMFLDEPTVGMDAKIRKEFLWKIQQLKKQGVTVVITSHYLEEIQKVADQLLILNEGKIVFDGTLDKLQSQYLTSTITFETNLSHSEFVNLTTIIQAREKDGKTVLITRDSDQTLYELKPYLENLHQILITKASLENIFITMMEGK